MSWDLLKVLMWIHVVFPKEVTLLTRALLTHEIFHSPLLLESENVEYQFIDELAASANEVAIVLQNLSGSEIDELLIGLNDIVRNDQEFAEELEFRTDYDDRLRTPLTPHQREIFTLLYEFLARLRENPVSILTLAEDIVEKYLGFPRELIEIIREFPQLADNIDSRSLIAITSFRRNIRLELMTLDATLGNFAAGEDDGQEIGLTSSIVSGIESLIERFGVEGAWVRGVQLFSQLGENFKDRRYQLRLVKAISKRSGKKGPNHTDGFTMVVVMISIFLVTPLALWLIDYLQHLFIDPAELASGLEQSFVMPFLVALPSQRSFGANQINQAIGHSRFDYLNLVAFDKPLPIDPTQHPANQNDPFKPRKILFHDRLKFSIHKLRQV